MRGLLSRRGVIGGLAVAVALSVVSPAIGGPSPLKLAKQALSQSKKAKKKATSAKKLAKANKEAIGEIPAGAQGPPGPPGPSKVFEVKRVGEATQQFPGGDGYHPVLTLSALPPGAYAITASAQVAVGAETNPNTDLPNCVLSAGGEQQSAATSIAGGENANLAVQVATTLTATGSAVLECAATNSWAATARLMAIKVGEVQSTEVTG